MNQSKRKPRRRDCGSENPRLAVWHLPNTATSPLAQTGTGIPLQFRNITNMAKGFNAALRVSKPRTRKKLVY